MSAIKKDDHDNTSIKSDIMNPCSICWENMKKPFLTNCKHKFHKKCLKQWLETNKTCPLCRTTIEIKKKKRNRITPENVVINMPQDNNQRLERPFFKRLLENKCFICFIVFGFLFSSIYNLIIIYMTGDYIDAYYNIKNVYDPIGFLLIYIFIFLLFSTSLRSDDTKHRNVAGATFCCEIIIIILYIHYYKKIIPFYSILSLNLKTNFIVSFGLHTFFNIINLITIFINNIA